MHHTVESRERAEKTLRRAAAYLERDRHMIEGSVAKLKASKKTLKLPIYRLPPDGDRPDDQL